MKNEKAPLEFLDGCLIERDFFMVSARMDAQRHDEYDHGRVKWYDTGKWVYRDRNWQVSSVCVVKPTAEEPRRGYAALEEGSGIVGTYYPNGNGSVDELLPGAKEGHGIASLIDITQIGDSLYVCGFGGNVMRRVAGKWEVFNNGLKTLDLGDYLKQGMEFSEALQTSFANQRDMIAIGGFNERAIYCVGREGLIFKSDGYAWVRLESPTNVDLNCLKCSDDGFVYAAGLSSVLLKGRNGNFQTIRTGVDDDFYALSWFKGNLYVGGLKGIYRLDSDGLHYVDINQGRFRCRALDSVDDQLLVVSERWLAVFDGVSWKRIDDPNNL